MAGDDHVPAAALVPSLILEVEAAAQLNFAMAHNAVPLVQRISVSNPGPHAVRDIHVQAALQPGFSSPWSARIAEIAAGGTYHLDQVDLPLDRERLINTIEREQARLAVCCLMAGSEPVLASTSREIEVLAYNEWCATTLPQLLAAFVLPNHPAIAETLTVARAILEERTGNPALDGYQSERPERVRAMAAAVYQAIQQHDITYVNPPASFEHTGQKIRTPEQVLATRMGTCLDLSVFLAACLEQAGLCPLVFVIEGHAFPGVWLRPGELPEAASDDAVRFRKLVELDTLCVVDAAAAAARPLLGFEQAERAALAHLRAASQLHFALDIRSARLQRFLPLPGRLDTRAFGMAPEVPAPASLATARGTAVQERANARPSSEPGRAAATGQTGTARPEMARPEAGRVDTWKRKLLDLSLRNRLLHFRDSKQSVRLLCPDLARLEDLLADAVPLTLRPRPELLSGRDPRNAVQLEARTHEDVLAGFLGDWLDRKVVHTDLGADELERRLVQIARTARASLEESGSNTLCVALGFLAWYESEDSDNRRLAPLLLVPVTLTRASMGDAFRLCGSDEDTRLNVTLLEKLRIEHGIELPELAELPEDESGVDLGRVLQLFRQAVLDLPRWEVVDEVQLGHFSFTKFLMWNDLEQKADSLLESQVVRHLALCPSEPYPAQEPFPAAERMDDEYAPADLLYPLDADSSQQAAILAAAQGRTFVLQGPPGTGKSQTIANLIAQCIAQGKRVLFVSEKMAALEVVHRRLSHAGLGPYCLELHSHKARKRWIVEELGRALEAENLAEPARAANQASTPDAGGWEDAAAALGEARGRVNAYAAALHLRRDLGISLFQGLSRLMGLRHAPRLGLALGQVTTRQQHQAMHEAVAALASAGKLVEPVAENPWRTTAPEDAGQQMAMPEHAASALRSLIDAAEKLATAARNLGQRVLAGAGSQVLSLEAIRRLAETGQLVAASPHPGQALLSEPDWESLEAAARQLISLGRGRDQDRAALEARYRSSLFELDLEDLAARFQRWSSAFFLFAWWMLRSARRALARVRKAGTLPGHAELAADVDTALTVRERSARLTAAAEQGRRLFGAAWDMPAVDWDRLERMVEWARALRASLRGLLVHVGADARPVVAERVLALAAPHGPAAGAAGMADALSPAELDAVRAALDTFLSARDQVVSLLGVDQAAAFGDPAEAGYLDQVRAVARAWQEALPRLRDWHLYVAARTAAEALGLTPLVASHESGQLAAEALMPAFERALYESWTSAILAAEPALRGFHGQEHGRRVTRFAELDRQHLVLAQAAARARVSARIPRQNAATASTSEVGILLRELGKKRRHLPIRVLFQRIPRLLQRLKPCLLMSPLSVAQYLDPAGESFDLVVFDEASQIPTHDAIGALARGQHAVIVGDSKQLPPTSFFQQVDAASGEESEPDEDAFEELESILDECVAAQLPELTLAWHYRSRHESLIAFSNYHYYRNRLNTFPSAADQVAHLGVSLRLIDGRYDRAKSRINRAEAVAVVDEIVQRLSGRLRAAGTAERSIGVVTFSKAQQDLIEDLLDQARREHPELERYFDAEAVLEPVIVKNLENIQGDERDVMLFSVCYGPDEHGKVAMNFGPLNRDGGERRLNVAVTRAREQLIVFSTLRPEQIELARTRAVGIKHLKTFLDYAQRGPLAIAEALVAPGAERFDSAFEQEVQARLIERGWIVRAQVGCAGYRVDLGVVHPDQPGWFVLGIECDGAHYQSARSARDRDRLRVQVLQGLGWRLHRIWSLDWWHDPGRELDKVEAAIRAALAAARPELSDHWPGDSPDEQPDEQLNGPLHDSRSDAHAQPGTAAQALGTTYVLATVPAGRRTPEQCYEAAHARELRKLAVNVLAQEAPVSTRLLARRIAPYWSLQRALGRLESRILEVLAELPEAERPQLRDGFVWRADQAPEHFDQVRVPGDDEASRREAQDIPLEEIAAAARAVLQANLAMGLEDLARETGRLFGFARLGGRMAARLKEGIALLVARGVAAMDSGDAGEQVSLRT